MAQVTMNSVKNGVEIRFDSKPAESVLIGLKGNGFRWSGKQKMWYAKQNPETLAFAATLSGDISSDDVGATKEQQKSESVMNLWQLTRTDDIPANFANTREYNTTVIAKTAREHLKERFGKLVKFSITSERNSIYPRLVSAPWDADSEMVKAIIHYAYCYIKSWNYDNSDPYSDYCDVNFFGNYEHNYIDKYGDKAFAKRETETETEKAIAEQFMKDKAAWEAAEEARMEQKRVADEKEREEAHRRNEEQRIIDEQNVAHIEENAVVDDVDSYFVLNLKYGGCKVSNIGQCEEEYPDQPEDNSNKARVTREVTLSRDDYNNLTGRLLMHDFSFFAGMGGTSTDDLRVQSWSDYEHMSAEERETVETYMDNCVAVWCDGEPKFVVDPQGYQYARYVYTLAENSAIDRAYQPSKGITEEEHAENLKAGEELKAIWLNSDATNFENGGELDPNPVRRIMVDYLTKHSMSVPVEAIRALPEEDREIKLNLYRVRDLFYSIPEQMKRAAFKDGEKITVVKMNDFGGIGVTHMTYCREEYRGWAQYDNLLHIIGGVEHKRGEFSLRIYNDVMIYRGWLDIPRDIFFQPVESGTPGVTCSMSIFGSCDRRMYDLVKDYAQRKYNAIPVVDHR